MPAWQPAGPTAFARRLRARREELGLSQLETAKRAGVSQDVLSRIERGNYVGSDETAKSLAAVLDLDERELLTLATEARDPVLFAISQSRRLSEDAKQQLVATYQQLLGADAADLEPLLVPLTVAAQMLSVSVSTVLRVAATGQLTMVRVGRNPRIVVQSIRQFIDDALR